MEKKANMKQLQKDRNDTLDGMEKFLYDLQSIEREKLEIEKQRLEFEKNTKDRVDISLKEYTALKEFERENKRLRDLMRKIRLEDYVDYIDPSSVEVSVGYNQFKMTNVLTIRFEAKDIKPKGTDYGM